MNVDSDLTFLLYARRLSSGDRRLHDLVEAAEAAIGEQLGFAAAPEGHRRMENRDSCFAHCCRNPGTPVVFTNGREGKGAVRLWILFDFGPGAEERTRFVITVSLDIASRLHCASVLPAIAKSAQAAWGFSETLKLAKLTSNQYHIDNPLPDGIPVLVQPTMLDDAVRPYSIGWINYWSPDAVRLLGIRRASLEQHRYTTAELTPGGALLIQLTEMPTDPDNPDHLAILVDAYRRFPGVGRIPAGEPAAPR